MTERVIRIVLDTSGVQAGQNRIETALGRVDRSAKGTNQTLRTLAQAAGLVLAGFGIRELGRVADSYTNLQNRLRLVTDGTAQLNAVQDELVGLAQRTRTSLDSVSTLYARTARSTRDLGLTQSEVIGLTESVSQALQISGASATEAAAGVIQFTQGLAGGIVRAEEFNSIVEQTPRLAEALASGLGIGLGELRAKVIAGELTSRSVIEALQREGETLQREFGLITPTLEQAGTTIKTFLQVAIGGFNEAAGVTEGLVDIFQLTDEETKALAQTVRDLGLAFREFVEVATVAVANFAEQVPSRFAKFRADIAGTLGVILGNDEVVDAAIADRIALEDEISAIQAKLDDEFELIRRNAEARSEALNNREADLDVGISGAVDRGEGGVDPKVLEKQAEFLDGLRQQVTELGIQAGALENSEAALLRYRTAIEASALGDAEFVAQALELADAINLQAEALEAAQNRAEDTALITALEDELELLGLSNRERAIEIELRNLSAEATAEQIARVRELAGAVFDEQEALKNQTTFLEDISERAAQNIQDSFADFLFDPFEDGLDGMVRSFVDSLRQMAAEALAAEIFKKLFGDGTGAGDGSGGFAQTLFGLFSGGFGGGRQHGGGVRPDQAFIVGERGPEIFSPPTSGQIMPAGGGGFGPPQVTVSPQIINVRDPSEIPAAIQSDPAAQEAILNVLRTNPDAVRQAVQ